jgi:hypothetical protein
MSGENSSNAAQSVIPFPSGGDPLDSAGTTIMGLLQQAAGVSEENNRRVREVAHKLSLQLRTAEEQIRDLETDVRYYRERAERAEQWLRQIALEIEKKFLASATDAGLSQAQPRQAASSPLDYAPRKNLRHA